VVPANKASAIPDYRMNQLGKEENPYVTLDCDYTWNYLYTFEASGMIVESTPAL
jgi:hypothetical protein